MRRILLAAVAAAAVASPAVARDGQTYVGIEGGATLVEDTKLDFISPNQNLDQAVNVDYGTGYDVDLIAGHDFGMLRAEVELGYKHAGVDEVVLGSGICTNIDNCILDADGSTRARLVCRRLVHVVDDDARALARELERDRAADTAPRARDERHLPFQLARARPRLRRLRLHRRAHEVTGASSRTNPSIAARIAAAPSPNIIVRWFPGTAT